MAFILSIVSEQRGRRVVQQPRVQQAPPQSLPGREDGAARRLLGDLDVQELRLAQLEVRRHEARVARLAVGRLCAARDVQDALWGAAAVEDEVVEIIDIEQQ